MIPERKPPKGIEFVIAGIPDVLYWGDEAISSQIKQIA